MFFTGSGAATGLGGGFTGSGFTGSGTGTGSGGGGAAVRATGLQISASTATGVTFCHETPTHRNPSSSTCISSARPSARMRPGSGGTRYGTADSFTMAVR